MLDAMISPKKLNNYSQTCKQKQHALSKLKIGNGGFLLEHLAVKIMHPIFSQEYDQVTF